MDTLIRQGQAILFMKVGTHANEDLEHIIERKTQEIEQTGYGLWGYGGNTCHPQTMVQPFAREHAVTGSILLVMEPMVSKHFAVTARADQFSVDGIHWEDIPLTINVLGSRFALVIKNLRREEFDLSLDRTWVAVGNSAGSPGGNYVKGRVDKACLLVGGEDEHRGLEKTVPIGLVADVVDPYAVHLRNLVPTSREPAELRSEER